MKSSPSHSELFFRIGQNICRMRHEKNEKLINVAMAIHKSESVMSRIECGKYYCISLALLQKLADYFHAEIDDLYLGKAT